MKTFFKFIGVGIFAFIASIVSLVYKFVDGFFLAIGMILAYHLLFEKIANFL